MAFANSLKDRLRSTDLLKPAGFVGSKWIEASGKPTFEVVDPATIASLPVMDARQTAAAVGAVFVAQKDWGAPGFDPA